MENKDGDVIIKRDFLGENEKIIKSICSTKLGICDVVYVAEFKYCFGFQNQRGYKMLMHACNGNKTVFAERIYRSLSGNITIINPMDKPKGEIRYTKDLRLIN